MADCLSNFEGRHCVSYLPWGLSIGLDRDFPQALVVVQADDGGGDEKLCTCTPICRDYLGLLVNHQTVGDYGNGRLRCSTYLKEFTTETEKPTRIPKITARGRGKSMGSGVRRALVSNSTSIAHCCVTWENPSPLCASFSLPTDDVSHSCLKRL